MRNCLSIFQITPDKRHLIYTAQNCVLYILYTRAEDERVDAQTGQKTAVRAESEPFPEVPKYVACRDNFILVFCGLILTVFDLDMRPQWTVPLELSNTFDTFFAGADLMVTNSSHVYSWRKEKRFLRNNSADIPLRVCEE